MGVRPKWDLDDPGDEALEGGSFYSGDVPPAGTYRCKVMGARVKLDKNDDERINFWLEIQETGAKKKYSGYRFYDGQSIAKREVQQRIWKQIIHALGFEWRDMRKTVYAGKPNSDEPVDLTKFAGVTIDKLPAVVIACRQTTYQGNVRLEAARWMPFVAKDEDVDDEDVDDEDEFEDEDEDGEEPPF